MCSLMYLSYFTAVANIGSFAVGAFVGGFITKRMDLSPRRTMGLLVIFYAFHIVFFATGLVLGCNRSPFVGPERYISSLDP